MFRRLTQDLTGALWFVQEPEREHPLSLWLEQAEGSAKWSGDGVGWEATGRLEAPGWLDPVRVQGRVVAEWRRRGVVYALGFHGPAGERHELRAELRFRSRAPVPSLTTIHGWVAGASGARIAEVELRWDLRHGWGERLRCWRQQRR